MSRTEKKSIVGALVETSRYRARAHSVHIFAAPVTGMGGTISWKCALAVGGARHVYERPRTLRRLGSTLVKDLRDRLVLWNQLEAALTGLKRQILVFLIKSKSGLFADNSGLFSLFKKIVLI
jgi:hypothetical protein